MGTWILLKGIPAEVYGINLEKWKKAQKTIVWREKQIKNEFLDKSIKRGAKVLQKGEKFSLIKEPSIKDDNAGNIFKNIRVRDKIDYSLLESFLEVSKISRGKIQKAISYYSERTTCNLNGFFVKKNKEGERKIIKKNQTKKVGSQLIVLRICLNESPYGLMTISYKREDDGTYKYEGSVVARQNEGKLDLKEIPQLLGLPSTFKLSESKIIHKIFEEDS